MMENAKMIGQLMLVLFAGLIVGKLLSNVIRDQFGVAICCGPAPAESQA
jgi:hypothetical protein